MWKFLSGLQAALHKGEEPPRFEVSWFREEGETYAHDAELFVSEEAAEGFRYASVSVAAASSGPC